MYQNYNKYKILKLFFDDPIDKYQLREISRLVSIAPTSVKRYLNELIKDGLVVKSKHKLHSYPIYSANRESVHFKFHKSVDLQMKLRDSGLIDGICDSCMPDVIILFGSGAMGEDLKQSDIDLFVFAKQKSLDLAKYEKKLKRRINLFFSEDFSKLSVELKNNVINGKILRGYLKLF